jgi:hypothetical protein
MRQPGKLDKEAAWAQDGTGQLTKVLRACTLLPESDCVEIAGQARVMGTGRFLVSGAS